MVGVVVVVVIVDIRVELVEVVVAFMFRTEVMTTGMVLKITYVPAEFEIAVSAAVVTKLVIITSKEVRFLNSNALVL